MSFIKCGEVAAMTQRRFPPPWTVEEYNDACFIVRDHNGQALACLLLGQAGPSMGRAAKSAMPAAASPDVSDTALKRREAIRVSGGCYPS